MNRNQVYKYLVESTHRLSNKLHRLYQEETISHLQEAVSFYLGDSVSPIHMKELLFPKPEDSLLLVEECLMKLPYKSIFLHGDMRVNSDSVPLNFSVLIRPRDDKWRYEAPRERDAELMEYMITPIMTHFPEERASGERQTALVIPFACMPVKLNSIGAISIFRESVLGMNVPNPFDEDNFHMPLVQLSETVVFYFLKLLACKNIFIREECLGKKNNKKRLPLLEYNTLHIKVPGDKYVYEDREYASIPFHEKEKFGMTGQKRGHFKTYTEDKPLFGRHVGTWWWSPIFDVKRKRDYAVKIA